MDDDRRSDPTSQLLGDFVRHVSEQVVVPEFAAGRSGPRRPRRARPGLRVLAAVIAAAVVVAVVALVVVYGPRQLADRPQPDAGDTTRSRAYATDARVHVDDLGRPALGDEHATDHLRSVHGDRDRTEPARDEPDHRHLHPLRRRRGREVLLPVFRQSRGHLRPLFRRPFGHDCAVGLPDESDVERRRRVHRHVGHRRRATLDVEDPLGDATVGRTGLSARFRGLGWPRSLCVRAGAVVVRRRLSCARGRAALVDRTVPGTGNGLQPLYVQGRDDGVVLTSAAPLTRRRPEHAVTGASIATEAGRPDGPPATG